MLTYTEIVEMIKATICELTDYQAEQDWNIEALLNESYGLNSVSFVQLLYDIQQKTGVMIDLSTMDLEDMDSIKNLAEYILRNRTEVSDE